MPALPESPVDVSGSERSFSACRVTFAPLHTFPLGTDVVPATVNLMEEPIMSKLPDKLVPNSVMPTCDFQLTPKSQTH
jgi:hypothetical protein